MRDNCIYHYKAQYKVGLHDIPFEHHHHNVRVRDSHMAGPAM